VPTPVGSDDLVWVGLPDERPRVLIMLFDETIDGGLEIDDGVEHAVFQASLGELDKEALDWGSSYGNLSNFMWRDYFIGSDYFDF
jgi:hypothetical protein